MQKRVKKILTFLLSVVLVTGCFSGLIYATANDMVEINERNFPNEYWREIVSKEFDSDNDGYLSSSERDVREMFIPGLIEEYFDDELLIDDITGIENFKSIKMLHCGGIGLVKLNVTDLKDLEMLTCQGNNLKELNIIQNQLLRELNCSNNQLTVLDLTYKRSLERVLCDENMIESLSLDLNNGQANGLKYLKCANNKISSINVSKSPNLRTLICSGNKLTSIDLSANTQLAGVTTYSIGGHEVDAPAIISEDMFSVRLPLPDASRVTLRNDDVRYEYGSFVTDDYSEILNGMVYYYATGLASSEPMDVKVNCTKNFYFVEFYTDESMETLYGVSTVNRGQGAVVPQIELPNCKFIDSWSDDFNNVTQDMKVYATYYEEHEDEKVVDFSRDSVVTTFCSGCELQKTFKFMKHISAKDEELFVPLLDQSGDGYINIDDFKILVTEYWD